MDANEVVDLSSNLAALSEFFLSLRDPIATTYSGIVGVTQRNIVNYVMATYENDTLEEVEKILLERQSKLSVIDHLTNARNILGLLSKFSIEYGNKYKDTDEWEDALFHRVTRNLVDMTENIATNIILSIEDQNA